MAKDVGKMQGYIQMLRIAMKVCPAMSDVVKQVAEDANSTCVDLQRIEGELDSMG
jgi:hypothetical protein